MLKIVQYGVHDVTYPRNARVRAAFQDRFDAEVVVVTQSRASSRLRRIRQDLHGLWRASAGADVVMLAEMRLTHAPLVWLVGRLRRAVVVIDRFIGLHETAVEDWGSVAAGSTRARRFALQDAIATGLGDLVVTDTAVRARALSAVTGREVLDLPVGAPAWAGSTAPIRPGSRLRVLYYGNYIPLHGTELVVDALAELTATRRFTATFVGNGVRRAAIEQRAAELGLRGRITFLDAVSESELAELVERHHVVLGVFGSSTKATSVVANKVWQGLAAGRVVVTQRSAAVEELARIAGPLLVQTDPGSAHAITSALADIELDALTTDSARAHTAQLAARLEDFVAVRFDRFSRRLAALVAGGPR
ncbi:MULTISPECIES: glycosyltransferase [unclassified Curtobacterium]|uniref:glycosyltransferase n=1 Tax=unclassified Curtobacterium TaxID=257496 RepID=UPI000F4B0AF5|nr:MULTISPECIES: glycosyltransferase [unclassified Curtobacterium]ROP65159.1 glycosyl transferase family 1 [Curtobacterium sp. ZW137]TCK65425.1 glycosyl transferase family 1 [Curtobacterium sp. PhB136]